MLASGAPFVPTIDDGELRIRSIRTRDARELERVLLENRPWLQPWEATLPGAAGRWNVRGSIRSLLDQASSRVTMPFVLEVDGAIVGQLTVSNIQYGAVSSASLGYWVAQSAAGHGYTPIAVAAVTDYCFKSIGLHRMEICIRPENKPSLRVVEKLGFRYEGKRDRYIHIDGDWRDHYCFALVREEVPRGVLNRWRDGAVDESVAARD
ncbi:GNAT family N-acetyltransferase [Gulosibacter molinativorax]|uniref:N-acetyltransferase n=1 Tax=Gulosibacter molinativorax TaxID=256821 RepID=A0ABT7C8I8_9MICO|nr:GNAT family protein [Gulosibacter molinativorax]MDJ1371470.1 N-acetyltransferase [Gulosibacter molinativorax]